MRRTLSLLLVASLLIAGCAGKGTVPPAPAPVPPPSDPASPPPHEAPPEPTGGLKELFRAAPDGEVTRVRLKAGQTVDRPGLYFMSVASGEIEGWVMGEHPDQWGSFSASADSRWIEVESGNKQYLVDRQAAAVYQWEAGAARLVAARGPALLFATEAKFWLADEGLQRFTAIELHPAQFPQAAIAPDGTALLLVNGQKLYRVGLPAGEVKQIGEIETAGDLSLIPIRQGTGAAVSVTTDSGPPFHRATTRLQRFDWTGLRLSDQTLPGALRSLSPDGALVTWREPLLGGVDSPLVVAGASDARPQFRLIGEDPCTALYTAGDPWLADGSGLVVFSAQGHRILRTDGRLEELPALADANWLDVPVPAPGRTDRFAIGGTRVVDGAGRTLAEAVLADGSYPGYMTPWGESSDEVRFTPRFGGKGFGCGPTIFPPTVERAPFAPVAGLQVVVAADDCLNLRRGSYRTAPVIRCLPNGSRLMGAVPPGINNKGELRRYANPMSTEMGGELWWHVRTEQGGRGWVLLSAEYLTWAPPLDGAPPDPVRELIADERENMLFWFRVALGEAPCDQATCAPGPSLQDSVWGLDQWCRGEGPGYIRREPGFDPNRHEAGLQALEETCASIRSAIDATKGFDDLDGWKQRVAALKNDLLSQVKR